MTDTYSATVDQRFPGARRGCLWKKPPARAKGRGGFFWRQSKKNRRQASSVGFFPCSVIPVKHAPVIRLYKASSSQATGISGFYSLNNRWAKNPHRLSKFFIFPIEQKTARATLRQLSAPFSPVKPAAPRFRDRNGQFRRFGFFDGINRKAGQGRICGKIGRNTRGFVFAISPAKPKAAFQRQNPRNTEGWFFGARGGEQKTNRRLARCRRLALLRRFSPSGGGAGCPAVLLTVSLPRGDNRLHSL